MNLPDFGNLNVVFLTTYGSHLFGTNTPESDFDAKGVFMPTADQILMGKVPRSISFNTKSSAKNEKNTKDDVDCELYSFGYFVDLAMSGQTVALEMLWAVNDYPLVFIKEGQPENVLVCTETFVALASMRHKFITKNMRAFMGYAKGQAVRYSLKGDKLNTARDVLKELNYLSENGWKKDKLGNHFYDLKMMFENDSNVKWVKDPNDIEMMEVCRRGLQPGITVDYAMSVMQGVVDTYGKRAKAAADHDGADFKALSHAMRITLELHDLYSTGELNFPFDNRRAGLLKEMKRGEWTVEQIMDNLDVWMNLVEGLIAKSGLREKVNPKPFNQIVLEAYKNVVLKEYGG